MVSTTGQQMLRFLSEPGGYVCEARQSVDHARPQMASVVTLSTRVGFAGSARSIHVTYRTDPSDDPELIFVGDLDSGGITVSRFRVDDAPPILLAYWRLGADRYLTTFMPARDPLDERTRAAPDQEGLDAVIRHVTLGSAFGLPLIALDGPLTHGDLRDPEQRDETQFAPPTEAPREWPVVQFRREPPWTLESGAVQMVLPMEDDPDSWAEASAVTRHHVRIACHGPADAADELRELVERIRSTLIPYAG